MVLSWVMNFLHFSWFFVFKKPFFSFTRHYFSTFRKCWRLLIFFVRSWIFLSLTFHFFYCRCLISECEPINSNEFDPDWLEHAIPFKDGHPDQCTRYQFIGSVDSKCAEEDFNRSQILACDGYIMKNNEQRLLSHVRFQHLIPGVFNICQQDLN